MSNKLLFVGGGNMARAIVIGMLEKSFNASDIYIIDRNAHKRNFFHELGANVSPDSHSFLPIIDTLVLAVKPQGAMETCQQLAQNLSDKCSLVISLMAGVTISTLHEWMGGSLTIVRAAPNTPASIQLGVTGLYADRSCLLPEQKIVVEKIMDAVGDWAWLQQEEQMNAITALSGSGPAYYFYFIEQMIKAAEDLGLPLEIAKKFAIQTAYGATSLARESDIDVAELRRQVTSKKGTTQAAINVMEEQQLPLIFLKALGAAYERANELSKEATMKQPNSADVLIESSEYPI